MCQDGETHHVFLCLCFAPLLRMYDVVRIYLPDTFIMHKSIEIGSGSMDLCDSFRTCIDTVWCVETENHMGFCGEMESESNRFELNEKKEEGKVRVSR